MNLPAIEGLIHRELPAARNGDGQAFSRIVAACQNPVSAIALAIVRDVPASEDVAQEAFVRAWHNLQRLQNPASFLPWLRQITRNLARDHLRERQRQPRPALDPDAAIAAAADPQPDPCGRLLDDERQQLAAELISALPDDSREALLLYYREGQSSQQVAALLGLSDAAVRKRLSRARQSVRADMLARFGEFARASAPSVGFSTLVASALGFTAPGTAAGSVFGSVAAAGGAKTVGKILAGSLGGIALAMVASLGAIYFGLRRYLRAPFDETERRQLIRSGLWSGAASLGFVVLLLVIARHGDGWLGAVLGTLGFMAVVFYQAMVVQPRVLARRHAHEARLDPVGAARRRRRQRILCWMGAATGLLFGFGGLLLGLVTSGRL
jgi:RNA polymerase sigma factor (sigma-70 family)